MSRSDMAPAFHAGRPSPCNEPGATFVNARHGLRSVDKDAGECDHLADAISATRIVLAAVESSRAGRTIEL